MGGYCVLVVVLLYLFNDIGCLFYCNVVLLFGLMASGYLLCFCFLSLVLQFARWMV